MRPTITIFALLLFIQAVLMGCALGKKEWPSAQESEDSFELELIQGDRQDNCLLLVVAVKGAAHRLWRASIQFETVGGNDGDGCTGCPFAPRDAIHFTRDQKGFVLEGKNLKLSICNLEPDKEYRFRVAGKSELSTAPLDYTDVFVTSP